MNGKTLVYSWILTSAFVLPSFLMAETTEVVLSNSMKCTKEELMRFFPEQIVESILVQGNVAKEKAEIIAQILAKKDIEIAKLAEQKPAKMDPNFLQDANKRQAAIQTYKEVVYQVFSQVLKENGVTDEGQIQQFLEKLQEARRNLFLECVRKQPKREK